MKYKQASREHVTHDATRQSRLHRLAAGVLAELARLGGRQPVQQTINQEAKGGTVGKIKQETSRGKTYYMAEVTDTNGKKHHVRVNEDGTLMSGRSARSSKSSTETTTNTTK